MDVRAGHMRQVEKVVETGIQRPEKEGSQEQGSEEGIRKEDKRGEGEVLEELGGGGKGRLADSKGG